MKAPSAAYQYPTWSSARKDIVGTSLGSSRLWFTVAEGILTEVYYPRIDIPQIKDLGFIIADDQGFWVELRRLGNYTVTLGRPGVPAAKIVHRHARFVFTLEICPSQRRDVLLLRYRLEGDEQLKAYALLATRLGDNAENNLASVVNHNGRTVLWAEQGPYGLALAAAGTDGNDAWLRCSVGCSEASDGWQDFNIHDRMTWEYDSAGPAAVALMGELPKEATLSLGFAITPQAAATLALSGLMDDFSAEWDAQIQAWEEWLGELQHPQLGTDIDEMLALSAVVLKSHEDRTYRGAMVASLSVPWGDFSQSRGGYHLVWVRDLVQSAGALVAMGASRTARDVLRYLIATQKQDGHWFQNQWLGGTAFWQGVQLDEVAFPVLLAAALHERSELDGIQIKDMVTRALGFLARQGPVTDQDRWEENAGINLFTLSVVIAALVEGSMFLDEAGRAFALRLADYWNSKLEDWTFVTNTRLSQKLRVSGYYVRTMPAGILANDNVKSEIIPIKNLTRNPDLLVSEQVSTDFLQLVRYGLRKADDPSILQSLQVIDHLLKTETPNGPVWHRYNDDGYGEHEDGRPFDGTGRGRGWPLLTGERGHYALVAGEDVLPYLRTMVAMSSHLGLLPEQVWDDTPITKFGLQPGEATGSAMPLVWAHGEFIKLCYSQALRYPVDRPAATWFRYRGVRPEIDYEIWQYDTGSTSLHAGNILCVVLNRPALMHWGTNSWNNLHDTETQDTGLGVYMVELSVRDLSAGETIQFTFFWRDTQSWEGRDHEISII
jgi:glucoamylase